MTRLAPQDGTLAAAAAVAVAAQLAFGGTGAFLPIILALIVVFGMPHGALDVALARHLWPIRSTRRLALFFALYLGLAAVVVAFWTATPTLALSVFLGYSAWHFSDDWQAVRGRAGQLAGGALVLALPALADGGRTAELFSALGADGPLVGRGLAVASVAAAPIFAVAARGHPVSLGRMTFLAGCAFALAPLAYFLVFFCGLHSVRHMREVSRRLGLDWRQSARRMLWPTLATLALLAVSGYALAAREVQIDAVLMQVVFVAFAALTVPHMLLVDRFDRCIANGGDIAQ